MNHVFLTSALAAALMLSACDRPVVVAVPAPVAGPAGPAGVAGSAGSDGSKGDAGIQGNEGVKGDAGDGTTVIVVPVEVSAPVQ